MKKVVCYKVCQILFALILVLLVPISVQAETLTTDLFNFDSTENIAVTIYYDSEEPIISFTAPDGQSYSKNNLEVATDDGVIVFYIPEAMPGEWDMVYDKLSNEELDVNCFPYEIDNNPVNIKEHQEDQNKEDIDGIKIDKFEVYSINEDGAELTFDVISSCDGDYIYSIYIKELDSNGGTINSKKVGGGTWYLNQTSNVFVNFEGLEANIDYHFYLKVSPSPSDDLEYSESVLLERSFTVNHPNSKVELKTDKETKKIDPIEHEKNSSLEEKDRNTIPTYFFIIAFFILVIIVVSVMAAVAIKRS